MKAKFASPNTIHRVFIGIGVSLLLLLASPLTTFHVLGADQQFTNGDMRDGSYFDHLVDGLAGDPQGGEGIVSQETSISDQEANSDEEPARSDWITVLKNKVAKHWSHVLAKWSRSQELAS